MESNKKNFTNYEGIQRDVNPLQMKDSDLLLSKNWYSREYGKKKVRFGYTTFLDAIDNQPVKNLIWYSLPTEKGLFRVSNSKMYKTTTFTGSWGSSVKSLGYSEKIGTTQMSGLYNYVHFSDQTDGYFTYDVTNGFKNWTLSQFGSPSKYPTYLSSWQSRIFADLNKLSLSASAIGFDTYTTYTTDPFLLNDNDPSGGGSISVNAGSDGQFIGMTSSADRIQMYKEFGVYRYNGQTFMRQPYWGNILTVCTTYNNIDYFLATNGIWKNDGSSIAMADFGIQSIIQDTIQVHGIVNPVSYSFGDYTMFFVGTIRINGTRNGYIDIPNGMFVHNEKYGSWDIWSLGHQMTAFGFYIDSSTNRPRLISGDINGNTYVWGEEYGSDAGIPIHYHLRTGYHNFDTPNHSKMADRYAIYMTQGDGASLNLACDYDDEYTYEQKNVGGFLTKDFMQGVRDFKAVSLEIKGSTVESRPEFNGEYIEFKDAEDRYENNKGKK